MTTVIEPATLIEALAERVRTRPNATAFTFLEDGERETASLTFSQLARRARSVAAHIQERGKEGDRALLLIPSGLDYVAAFLGCLYAGIIAVPAYPPIRKKRDPRIEVLLQDAGALLALTTSQLIPDIDLDGMVSLERKPDLVAVDALADAADDCRLLERSPSALAYLQYTSGSTSKPKGVMVSHRNVVQNCWEIARNAKVDEHGVALSWLPPFHDMGLLAGIALPIVVGLPSVLMSPNAFLRRPIRWLRAISRHGATFSGGPNSSYDLCVEKTTASDREGLDLSRWATAFNGSEPVRRQTLDAFAHTFAACGFKTSAFGPAYGMAEATLMISAAMGPTEPVSLVLSAAALEKGEIVPADEPQDARDVVACGPPEEMTVAIVDPASRNRAPVNRIGEIWVSGPSVALGYWNKPEETRHTFENILEGSNGTFLRTGDLGFMLHGEVFVTGRLKDLIIVRGRNLYPDDLEMTAAGSHPALRANGGAAFSIEHKGTEQVVVVQAVDRRQLTDLDTDAVIRSIRRAISEEYEVDLMAVVLTTSGHIPRTTSGKIARSACREKFLKSELNPVASWRRPETSGRSEREIRNWLIVELAKRFYLDITEIDPDRPFTELGLDSLSALDFTVALEEWLGVPLGDTLFWDYPTPSEVARHLADSPAESPEPPLRRG